MKTCLIDNSVWVSILRGSPDGALNETVSSLLSSHQAAMCEVVWLELYRGVRGKAELKRLGSLKELCRWLPINEPVWEMAYEFGRNCLKTGTTVPMSDLLIYCTASRYGADLLHIDGHFDHLEELFQEMRH